MPRKAFLQRRAIGRRSVGVLLRLSGKRPGLGKARVGRRASASRSVAEGGKLVERRAGFVAAGAFDVDFLLQGRHLSIAALDTPRAARKRFARGGYARLDAARLLRKKHVRRFEPLDQHVQTGDPLRGLACIEALPLEKRLDILRRARDFVEVKLRGLYRGAGLLLARLRRLPAFLQRAHVVDGESELDGFELGRKRAMRLGAGGFAGERLELAFHFGSHVFDAREMLVHGCDLAGGALLSLLMFEHARRLFDQGATLLRAACQDGIEVSLADDRMDARPQARVVQDIHEIKASGRRAVYKVFAFAAAIHPTRERHFGIIDRQGHIGVVEHQVYLGQAHAAASRRSGENDVFHSLPAQILRIALAEDP